MILSRQHIKPLIPMPNIDNIPTRKWRLNGRKYATDALRVVFRKAITTSAVTSWYI